MRRHWMARYWPWRGEIVIGGRPLAAEFFKAFSRRGSGVRRLRVASVSMRVRWWRWEVPVAILVSS